MALYDPKLSWKDSNPNNPTDPDTIATAADLLRIEAGIRDSELGTNLYCTSSNSGNDYTINPGINAPIEGVPFKVKVNANSTGAVRLRLGTGTYFNVKDPDGNVVTSWKSGGVYTVIYNGINFCQLGKGTEYAIGRLNADWGFNNSVFANCGLNSSGEVTLDDYNYNSTFSANTLSSWYALQGGSPYNIGQRLDATFTADISKINYVELYLNKTDGGNLPNFTLQLYDESSSTLLSSVVVQKASIINGLNRFYFNYPITKGHVLQIRTSNITYNSSNYYQIGYSTSSILANTLLVTDSSSAWSGGGNTTQMPAQDMYININCNMNPLQTSGSVVKTITPNKVDSWGNLKFTQVIPANTTMICDVLNSSGTTIKSNVTSIADLADLNVSTYPTIKVKYTLTRTGTGITTPKVSNSSVTWEGVTKTTPNSQTFSSSGMFNFTAPRTGIYKVTVVGAGGGGGYYSSGRQGQGAGGGMSIGYVTLIAGQSYPVVVGAGGRYGGSLSPVNIYGETGGTSSFAGISATGGQGGRGDTYYGYGGSPGVGSGGIYNLSGEPGGAQVMNGSEQTSYYAQGNSPYDFTIGKGGYGGGNGQNGIVIIEWEEIT